MPRSDPPPARGRLPSLTGRSGEPRAPSVYDEDQEDDTVRRAVDFRTLYTELRLALGYLTQRVAELEEQAEHRGRLDVEATKAQLADLRAKERARTEAEQKARDEEAKRQEARRYETRVKVALAVLGVVLGIVGSWAKGKLGW